MQGLLISHSSFLSCPVCPCRQRTSWRHQCHPQQHQPLAAAFPTLLPPSTQHCTCQIQRMVSPQMQQQHCRTSVVVAAGRQEPHSRLQEQQQQQPKQQQQRSKLFPQPQTPQQPAAAAQKAQEEEEGGDLMDGDEGEGLEGSLDDEWEEEEQEEEEGGGEREGDAEVGVDPVAAAPAALQKIPGSATTVEFTQDGFVEVGRISRPHGIRGEVKVQLITDEPRKRLGTRGKRLWLKPLPSSSGLVPPTMAAARQADGPEAAGGKLLQRVVVESGRVANPGSKGQSPQWAVKFEGINTREQAAALAGNLLLLALCDREAKPRGCDEFFIDQLVGLRAVDASSKALVGVVTEVYESGSSYSLLRLRLAPEEADIAGSTFRSLLVPFVSEMVPTVDVEAGQLEVDLPEGMLDTAGKAKKLRRPYTQEQQAQLRRQLAQRLEQQRAWDEQQQRDQQQEKE